MACIGDDFHVLQERREVGHLGCFSAFGHRAQALLTAPTKASVPTRFPTAEGGGLRLVRVLSGGAGGLGGFGCYWQLHREEGTAFGPVAASDLAGMILDDSIDRAEAQACALAYGFGGVEGIEDALRVLKAGA